MKFNWHPIFTWSLFLWLSYLPYSANAEASTLEEATNFQQLSENMQAKRLPLLLAFHAEHCHYCQRLFEEQLIPIIKNGAYAERIVIRTFDIDNLGSIQDFNGEQISAEQFTKRYEAFLTPTLVFLDANGQEVVKRIRGYNSPDYYGAYLEQAINAAQTAVQ